MLGMILSLHELPFMHCSLHKMRFWLDMSVCPLARNSCLVLQFDALFIIWLKFNSQKKIYRSHVIPKHYNHSSHNSDMTTSPSLSRREAAFRDLSIAAFTRLACRSVRGRA